MRIMINNIHRQFCYLVVRKFCRNLDGRWTTERSTTLTVRMSGALDVDGIKMPGLLEYVGVSRLPQSTSANKRYRWERCFHCMLISCRSMADFSKTRFRIFSSASSPFSPCNYHASG